MQPQSNIILVDGRVVMVIDSLQCIFPKVEVHYMVWLKPGTIIWSRIYIEDARLKMDIGLAEVIELPEAETRRRLNETTPEWPIMHAV